MNTNIMNINNFAKATLVATLVVAVSFSVIKLSKADTSGCNAQTSLSGSIVSTGEFGGGAIAKVKNNSDCSFDIGFASYKMPHISPDPRTDQQLFDSKTLRIGPRQSVELRVNVPNCRYQLDLFHGPVMAVPYYEAVILDYAFVRDNICVSPNVFVNLNFIVKDVCTNNPVSGALVTINQNFGNGSTRTTDGSGFANFGVLTNKTIGWSVSKNGFSSSSGSVSSGTSNKTVNVTLNRTCATPTPTPIPPTPTPTPTPNVFVNLNFIVKDVCTNNPVSGALVTINQNFGNGSTRTTDGSGFANFGVLTNKTIGWSVSKNGFSSSNGSVSSGTSNKTVNVTLNRTCATPTPTVYKASGTVFLDNNRNGVLDSGDTRLAGETVFLTNTPDTTILRTIQTDSSGNYLFANLSAGNYRVKHLVPSGYVRTTDDSSAFTVGPNFIHNFGIYKNIAPTPTPWPTPTPIPTPYPTPIIALFTAAPAVCVGQAIDLVWNTVNASEVTISPNIGSVPLRGDRLITPTHTTIYVLTATNTQGASATASTTVEVTGPCSTPTPTPNPILYPTLNILKMVRNVTSNTSEVKSVNANVNDAIEFVIRVSTSNYQGQETATNVRVTDSLPYGLTYVSGSTTIDNSYSTEGITSNGINLGSFYSGRLVTIRFRATVGQGYNYNQYNYGSTTFTNSASAYADNTSTVTDSASVIVATIQPNQSTLTIQKTARNISMGGNIQQTSLSARAGDGIEFTITVTAPYNTNLTNVVVSDLLPAGMKYTVNSTTLNNIVTTDGIVSGGLNIGSLSAGQKAEIKFYATINAGAMVNQQLVNTATARADNVSLVTSQPVYITIGNNVILAGALKVRTGPAGDAFALAGFGGLFSSALYASRRKLLGLVRLA